jgi:hypothetical protein
MGNVNERLKMKVHCFILVIVCWQLVAGYSATGQTWTPTSAPSNMWSSIVSSADGSKLAALADKVCFTSTNFGATWSSNGFPNSANGGDGFSLLAGSADGTHLVAATDNSAEIDVSTNGGATWNKSTNYAEVAWESITSSADGKKLVLTQVDFPIYASTNGGAKWYPFLTLPNNGDEPQHVAMSADGNSLTIVASSYVVTTTNFGKNWVTNTLSTLCKEMAVSADGKKLITAPYGGNIYTSTNSGANWIQQTNSPNLLWWSCASSADGTELAAVSGTAGGTGVIYTSTDSGIAWVSNTIPNQQWISIASSADGNELVAIVNGNDPVAPGGIWILQTTPSPQLNLSYSNGNLNLSWIVPSTNFVLQQSSTFSENDWTTVTNLLALNLSNLEVQLSLASTNSSGFFRLATQ